MDKIRFSAFMVSLRKEKGVTQKELAEELKVSDKAVSRWENGKNYPDIEIMQRIAEYFDVTVNELFQGGRISEEQLKEASDQNIVIALKRLKNDKDRNLAIITLLFLIVVFLICLLCHPVDNFIRGVRADTLSITSRDARTTVFCIDGYITSEAGEPDALSEINVTLHGDKVLEGLYLQGTTAEGHELFCNVYLENDLCQARVSYTKNTVKAKPEGISARDLAEFIDILDFAEYDPDYSDDNVYGILSVEKEDYNDSRGGEGGKTASIYDAENKTFAGIETENPAEGQYAYIALLKYGTKDKDRHMGEAIAHICWKW